MLGHVTYLALELAWGLPIIGIQWLLGHDVLALRARLLTVATIAPTAYLCLADGVAIHAHIWALSPSRLIGVYTFGLPIEECVFFLITNLMIVQTVVLVGLDPWPPPVAALRRFSAGRGQAR